MGQRGLLLLEKISNSMLWSNIWNLSPTNLAWISLNNNIYELYFFYIFLYTSQNHLAFFRPPKYYRKLLNYKSRKKLVLNLNIKKRFSHPTIYNILRFNKWILVIIFYIKILKFPKTHVSEFKLKKNYLLYITDNLEILSH